MTAGWPATDAPEAAALRLVLTLALSTREAADLLARATNVDGLWPSAVVAALGDALVDDEQLWREVTVILDQRLAPWLAEFGDRPLRDLLARVSGEIDVDAPALAALLWSLVRRRQRALGPVLARLVRETYGLIVADAGRRARDLRGASAPLGGHALQDMSHLKSHSIVVSTTP